MTPPGRLDIRTAGFWRRALALLPDLALIGGLAALLGWALRQPLGLDELPRVRIIGVEYLLELFLDRGDLLVPLVGGVVVMTLLYFTLLHLLLGWTPGKLLLGLRVIDPMGRKPSPLRATTRSLAWLISGILLGLGFLWAGFDRDRRAFHDLIAGTYVVSSRSLRQGKAALAHRRDPLAETKGHEGKKNG